MSRSRAVLLGAPAAILTFTLASLQHGFSAAGERPDAPSATRRILAVSHGALADADRDRLLMRLLIRLTGKAEPRVCLLPTARGDDPARITLFYDVMNRLPCRPRHQRLFINSPEARNFEDELLSADAIFVGGGNTVNMLAVWKAQGVDSILRRAWEKGIVLAGESAGANCWFTDAATDSRPGQLSAVSGLGLLEGSFCPHYDSEKERRPIYHNLVQSGKLSEGMAADDGVALVYEGKKLTRVVSALPRARAYRVRRNGGKVEEAVIQPDLLSTATSAVEAKVDAYVRGQMQRQKIPGLSLAVVKDGHVVHAGGYGQANVEHGVPATAETVYQSGSLGKQFTAAAVMLLVESGKLKLDAPISDYLPGTPPAWKAVTVRHLLTHTSGIKDYSPRDVNLREDHTEELLLGKFAAFKMDFAPGTSYRYSNSGYALLGMLIRKASGQFHGDFLRSRILAPLDMDSTRVISEADVVPHRAAGYRLRKRQVKNQDWVAPSLNTFADGCLYTTALDLAKWDLSLGGEKVLKNSTLAQMWTPVQTADGKEQPYGFGWKLSKVGDHKTIEHRGAWQGFRTFMVRYPASRLTVIVLCNLSTGGAERIAKQVAGLYEPGLTPPVIKPIKDPQPEVAGLLRGVLESLAAGKLDEKLFTPQMRKEFFPDDAEYWQDVLGNVGPLTSLELVARDVEKGTRLCQYRADFGEIGLRISLSLTPANEIAGLTLEQY